MTTYQPRGLHGRVVHELALRILSGRVGPGDTLDPARLERELAVSRSVLREALKVLAAKGLVDARPKRGTFVRPRADWNLLDADVIRWRGRGPADPGFLAELDEVRTIVEPAGARLAARRRTPDDLAALEAALDRMAAAHPAGGTEAVAADLAFHRALLAAARNELLSRMEMVLEAALEVRDRLVHGGTPAPPPRDPVPSHRAVVDAVRAGDPEAADAAVRGLLALAAADATSC